MLGGEDMDPVSFEKSEGGFSCEKEKMVFHTDCDGNGIFHDPGNGAGRGDRWEP